MSKKYTMSFVKKLTAGILAITMLVAGIVIVSKQADATDVVDATTVICEAYTKSEIEKNYWTTTSRTAPTKSGYVFGGWFRKATGSDIDTESLTCNGSKDNYVPLTKDEMTEAVPETAYAKFVPAQVLSVKAQNQSGVDEDYIANLNKDWTEGQEKDSFWVRVMTSLDSKNYDKIGFDIYLANKKQLKNQDGGTLLETNRIYTGLLENGTVRDASDLFGEASEYVCVWQLDKIDTPSNANKIIYVRPYWYTMDGTKVLGLAKYVHIEDSYKNYINVPVNLLGGEQVAAGAVNMTYANSEGKNIALKFKEVEAGRMLPEMNVTQGDGVIKMVGNAKTVDSYHVDKSNTKETLYANVRFEKITNITDVDVDFSMNMIQFCDWSEKDVDVEKVWDVKYDVKETTNQ